MIADDRFERVPVASAHELHAWLREHHGQEQAVWLVTWKKVVPDRHTTREEVLDALVAFGWTDGIMRRVDEQRVAQLVSPRRNRAWARTYQVRAERLIAQGRMQPSGLADVEHAKATGGWDATKDVDDLLVPKDLREALEAAPPAAQRFAAFPPSTRRNVLRWIAAARTAPTRAARIARTAADAQRDVRTKSNG